MLTFKSSIFQSRNNNREKISVFTDLLLFILINSCYLIEILCYSMNSMFHICRFKANYKQNVIQVSPKWIWILQSSMEKYAYEFEAIISPNGFNDIETEKLAEKGRWWMCWECEGWYAVFIINTHALLCCWSWIWL